MCAVIALIYVDRVLATGVSLLADNWRPLLLAGRQHLVPFT